MLERLYQVDLLWNNAIKDKKSGGRSLGRGKDWLSIQLVILSAQLSSLLNIMIY